MRSHGGDPTVGPRLVTHLVAAGLVDVRERTVVNPMTTTHEELFLAQLLDDMREAMVEAGAVTPDELDDLRAAVPRWRRHQVSGRPR